MCGSRAYNKVIEITRVEATLDGGKHCDGRATWWRSARLMYTNKSFGQAIGHMG